MRALQFIYTSWKNGSSTKKGYMVYSKSEGITDGEADDIKEVMRYTPPRSLNLTPEPEEIKNEFPYNFAYFQLRSGRTCIALSTYLGKDYTNRFGNYLIYALVVNPEDLADYPVEFFGEPFMKTSMTAEELEADSPVPPLTPLEIQDVGHIVDDDLLMDFVIDREEMVSYFTSAALEARRERVPFYINDSRENLILWMSVLQKLFPVSVARNIFFSTYVFDQEKMHVNDRENRCLVLDLQGIRPDANGFDYTASVDSSRQIVMDALSGIRTKDIKPLKIADDLVQDFTMGMGEIDAFGDYLQQSGYCGFDYGLSYAYLLYVLQKYERFEYHRGELKNILVFARDCLNDETNKDAALGLLKQKETYIETLSIDDAAALVTFLYHYAGFMSFSIHSLLFEFLLGRAAESGDSAGIFSLLDRVRRAEPGSFEDMLNYYASDDIQSRQLQYMTEHTDVNSNRFSVSFILTYYRPNTQTFRKTHPLLMKCVDNLASYRNIGDNIVFLLKKCVGQPELMPDIIGRFLKTAEANHVDVSGNVEDWIENEPDEDRARFILKNLTDHPETLQLGLDVSSLYIRKSRNRSKAFWDFYDGQYRSLPRNVTFNINSILDAYLDKYSDKDIPFDEASRLLDRLDEGLLTAYPKIGIIFEAIESMPVKRISKLHPAILETMVRLAAQTGHEKECPKSTMIYRAERFPAAVRQGHHFPDIWKIYPINLRGITGRDYKEYLDLYLAQLAETMTDADDVTELFCGLCTPSEENVFFDAFIDLLKDAYKNDEDTWIQWMVWTCTMLIDYPKCNKEISDFEPVFFRYLKKTDKETFGWIRTRSEETAVNGKKTDFFEGSPDKRSLFNRVSDVFSKR